MVLLLRITVLALALLLPLWIQPLAEPAIKLTLDSGALVYAGTDEADWASYATAELDIQSPASGDVRGRFTMTSALVAVNGSVTAQFDVVRLFIRANLPLFDGFVPRLSVGKNNITWGKGAFFNAGNLFFGRAGNSGLLSSASALARNETDWLAVLYIPMGPLSFAEVAAGIPLQSFSLNASPLGALVLPEPVMAGTSAEYGIRLAGNFDTFAGEAAWHYIQAGRHTNISEDMHELACSVSGSLGGLEVYGSYACALPYKDARITAGLLAISFIPALDVSSFRLEALIQPEKAWEEEELTLEERLLGYPYGAHILADMMVGMGTFTVTARSLYSPVDNSALFTLMLIWKPYQGLWYYAVGSMKAGQQGDLYESWQSGSWSALVGMKLIL